MPGSCCGGEAEGGDNGVGIGASSTCARAPVGCYYDNIELQLSAEFIGVMTFADARTKSLTVISWRLATCDQWLGGNSPSTRYLLVLCICISDSTPQKAAER